MSLVNETVYLIQVYPRAAKMQTLKNGLPVRANIAINFQTILRLKHRYIFGLMLIVTDINN
jgi:hypothetical protein